MTDNDILKIQIMTLSHVIENIKEAQVETKVLLKKNKISENNGFGEGYFGAQNDIIEALNKMIETFEENIKRIIKP